MKMSIKPGDGAMTRIPQLIIVVSIMISSLDTIILYANTKSIQVYNPITLLTPQRFDIMAKYIYAKHRDLGVQSPWASELYKRHIQVWVNFIEPSFTDPHNNKRGESAYINGFNTILDSIKADGFDPRKSLIYTSKNQLRNGAHRLTACLLYNKKITGQEIANLKPHATASYFKNRKKYVKEGLSDSYLDAMALQYAQLKKNTFIALIFPCIQPNKKAIDSYFKTYGEIVYEKNIYLSKIGALNLIKTAYEDASWIGDIKNNFKGAHRNVGKRFRNMTDNYYTVRVVLFECQSLNKVRECKAKIRNIYKIGPYPIHINDTHQETLTLAQTVFNENSINFLNNQAIKTGPELDHLIKLYKIFLRTHGLDSENCCIIPNVSHSSNNVLFIHHYDNNALQTPQSQALPCLCINNLEPYNVVSMRDNIIFNPAHHFYYKNVKFQIPL